MVILGITHPTGWNNAACLLVDGRLVAMVEEERLTRVKYAPRIFPVAAIDYCLREAGISLRDIDVVAVGFERPWPASVGNLQAQSLLFGIPAMLMTWPGVWLHTRRVRFRDGSPEVVFVNHHLAHAASAFFSSDFDESACLTLDGSGGGESGILAKAAGHTIEVLARIPNESSWGTLYSRGTQALGFHGHQDEGKVMGLAAYGTPAADGFPFVDWSGEIPRIRPWAMRRFLRKERSGNYCRTAGREITDHRKNLAATLQAVLERAALQIVRTLVNPRTGTGNLCLAGGVALNCSMNGRILRSGAVKNIFIQPAAHDAGTALGAACVVYAERVGQRPELGFTHAYWGPSYSDREIQACLEASGLSFSRESDIALRVAALLAENRVVGWFQGRLEVGPRALGNRSILANPANPDAKDLINRRVKHREPWRPFAPSILEKAIHRYLKDASRSPFMLLAFEAKRECWRDLISAIHIDGSCRPQTVDPQTNPRFHNLITEFERLTGIAAVLNTSLNDNSEPIVCSPEDAVKTFRRCEMDYLAIGNFLVRRSGPY